VHTPPVLDWFDLIEWYAFRLFLLVTFLYTLWQLFKHKRREWEAISWSGMEINEVIQELKRLGSDIPNHSGVMGHDGLIRIQINGELYTFEQARELLAKEKKKSATA
jgi:hypothetical protein